MSDARSQNSDSIPALAMGEVGLPVDNTAGRGSASVSMDNQSLLTLVSDRLCGRWKYAIPLSIVLAVCFSLAGYHSAQKTYESMGIVRVAPNISPIMRQTIETGLMPLYGSFVQTQAALILSQRVVERAVESLDINELQWETRHEAVNGIQEKLTAESGRGSELIIVRFESDSPVVAQRVINAVLSAYDELYGAADGDEMGRKLQTLRTIRENLRAQRRQKRTQIQELLAASEYAVNDFDTLINQKVLRIQDSEVELRRVEGTLELMNARLGNGELRDPRAPQDGTSMEDMVIDPRALEAFDAELARLALMREQARLEFDKAAERFRPGHLGYTLAEEDLRVIERRYADRAAIAKQDYIAGGHTPALDPTVELQMRAEQLREEIEADRAAAKQMSDLQLLLTDLRTEEADIDHDLANASARIRELEIESESIRTGRITIESRGDLPIHPSRDRRKALAAVGALGGFGLSYALFFLLGAIDRRAFAVGQLSHSGDNVLGVLPTLPSKRNDLETSGIAAHCVHQIRNHIEAARRTSGPVAIAISSPYQGDGKTSLVLALGASYSASGYRTILIDGDIVSSSLTYHLQMSGQSGLQDALIAGAVNGYVKSLPNSSLSILPTGSQPHFGPEKVRRHDFDALLKQLRSDFDVILIDTGPLVGSIESLPVAAASDGVILTVRRGRRQAQLESCIQSLRRIKANFLGVVLNHAAFSDCNRYVSTSKTSAELLEAASDAESSTNAPSSRNALMRAMQFDRDSREPAGRP